MDTERILVLGAGELGMAVLRALTGSDGRSGTAAVSVLLRPETVESSDPAKQHDIARMRHWGVAIEPGDVVAWTSAQLAEVFGGFDTVISCVGFAAGVGTQLKLARAVLAAGVRRFVPWQFGVDYDVIGRGSPQELFDEQLDVRDLLRSQSDSEWLIISTGIFTSFLFHPPFGVVDVPGRTVHALGSWDTAVTVTTPEDIGALTARILFAVPRFANEVIYLAGDTITYSDLADLAEQALGCKVDRVLRPVSSLIEESEGDPDDSMKKYRAVFAQGKGVAWDMGDTFNGRHGIVTTTAAQWARDNLKPAPVR